jgi:hypothetical protein
MQSKIAGTQVKEVLYYGAMRPLDYGNFKQTDKLRPTPMENIVQW